jgi:hypothetical protein
MIKSVSFFNCKIFQFLVITTEYLPVHRGRDEIGGVYLPSQLERTRTMQLCTYVMLNVVKGGGGVHPPPLTSLGLFFHHDGMYAGKRLLPLCVYSVLITNLDLDEDPDPVFNEYGSAALKGTVA